MDGWFGFKGNTGRLGRPKSYRLRKGERLDLMGWNGEGSAQALEGWLGPRLGKADRLRCGLVG